MSKPEHNEKNVDRLATEVTDAHDLEALIQCFYENQYDYYTSDKEAFYTDWEYMGIEDE